jgi:hypothetical protein
VGAWAATIPPRAPHLTTEPPPIRKRSARRTISTPPRPARALPDLAERGDLVGVRHPRAALGTIRT